MMNGVRKWATVSTRSREGNGPRFKEDGFPMDVVADVLKWGFASCFGLQCTMPGTEATLAIRCAGDRGSECLLLHTDYRDNH
jgi:hypothetical protein